LAKENFLDGSQFSKMLLSKVMQVLSFPENQKNLISCRRGIGSLKTLITFDDN